jgi:hypothetical protein
MAFNLDTIRENLKKVFELAVEYSRDNVNEHVNIIVHNGKEFHIAFEIKENGIVFLWTAIENIQNIQHLPPIQIHQNCIYIEKNVPGPDYLGHPHWMKYVFRLQ